MQEAIDSYIRVFKLLDTKGSGFVDASCLYETCQTLFGALSDGNSLVQAIVTSESRSCIDFLDFYVFCLQNQITTCYKDFSTVRDVVLGQATQPKASIALARLSDLLDSFGIECDVQSLSALTRYVFGFAKDTLQARDIMEIFEVFGDTGPY